MQNYAKLCKTTQKLRKTTYYLGGSGKSPDSLVGVEHHFLTMGFWTVLGLTRLRICETTQNYEKLRKTMQNYPKLHKNYTKLYKTRKNTQNYAKLCKTTQNYAKLCITLVEQEQARAQIP